MRTFKTALIFIILVSFLIVNIVYSQTISPLYLGLINGKYEAVVTFLKDIKKLPDFKNQMTQYKKIYGQKVEEAVFSEDKQRAQTIIELKEILNKNPNARDVLYNLYLLEKDAGNQAEAQSYLNKAREVDPKIK